MIVPANIGFIVPSIRLMKEKKMHFVFPEAHLVFIHHKSVGGLDW